MARPVVRGIHPTIYPEMSEGQFRSVCGIKVTDYLLSNDGKWVLQHSNMKFAEDENPKKKGHLFPTVTEKMPIHQLVFNLKWIADQMAVIKNAEKVL